jgi:hypothetical protein
MPQSSEFSKFCKSHKIGTDKIGWSVRGDKSVKVSLKKADLAKDSWSLLSLAVQFAMKELGIEADITFRESKESLDITLEK